jgi:hypothetical protein
MHGTLNKTFSTFRESTYTWTEDLAPPVLTGIPADIDHGYYPELSAYNEEVTASDQQSGALLLVDDITLTNLMTKWFF